MIKCPIATSWSFDQNSKLLMANLPTELRGGAGNLSVWKNGHKWVMGYVRIGYTKLGLFM